MFEQLAQKLDIISRDAGMLAVNFRKIAKGVITPVELGKQWGERSDRIAAAWSEIVVMLDKYK